MNGDIEQNRRRTKRALGSEHHIFQMFGSSIYYIYMCIYMNPILCVIDDDVLAI